jgi:hypothetical protein
LKLKWRKEINKIRFKYHSSNKLTYNVFRWFKSRSNILNYFLYEWYNFWFCFNFNFHTQVKRRKRAFIGFWIGIFGIFSSLPYYMQTFQGFIHPIRFIVFLGFLGSWSQQKWFILPPVSLFFSRILCCCIDRMTEFFFKKRETIKLQ